MGPYLRSDAAQAYFAFSDAFQARFGKSLSITEAYRDYDRQVALYQVYQNGTGNLAAQPGTSVHGWALACDFGSGVNSYGTAEKDWADANGPTYGWEPTGNGFGQREPWHFEYNGTYTPGEDEDMTPEQDARLKNIENLLAVESGGGIRGTVNNIKAIGNNLESILAKDNGGGIRAVVNAIKAKVGA
ncbi:M15 family metallopeptidase [Curtobacterium citreum]